MVKAAPGSAIEHWHTPYPGGEPQNRQSDRGTRVSGQGDIDRENISSA